MFSILAPRRGWRNQVPPVADPVIDRWEVSFVASLVSNAILVNGRVPHVRR